MDNPTFFFTHLYAQTGQKEFIRQVYSVASRHGFLLT